MKALGHVFKYGDNVDTDVIIPARYLNSFDGKELANFYRERGWEKKEGGISLSNYFSLLGRISVLFFPRNSLFY